MPIKSTGNWDHFSGRPMSVFVDGELVDTIYITGDTYLGDSFEQTPAMEKAIGDREVKDVTFVGSMIMVTLK